MNKQSEKLLRSDFVHLHNHTQYSLLDGLTKIPKLVSFIKDSGMSAVAITDHGTMSGVIEFYKECRAAGINPILGMETYLAARNLSDKEVSYDKQNYHLTLLAMNEVGYKNLMQLSSIANLEGFYYKPRIDKKILKKYSQGLICLSGCIGGEVGDLIRQGQIDQARKVIIWYKELFGDRYYLEIQDHGHPDHPKTWLEQTNLNQQLLKFSTELNIDCVLTSDAHYLAKEDQMAHEILLCVQTGSLLNDTKRMSLKDFDLHVASSEEIIDRWGQDHPELILNTKRIADKCQVEILLGNMLIPRFPLENGLSEKKYLDDKVYRGLIERYCPDFDLKNDQIISKEMTEKMLTPEVYQRAQYELSVINKMGFNGYFLIVADFINWGKDQGIVFGPGRGSAAGSIVAYSLRITELDPLKYDLMFERFLNPDRISMPDVDIDIQDNRRQEVIDYCVTKYGSDRVANIVTFGRMAARNAVRDVARVLGEPYAIADRLSKMIPPPVQGRHIPLSVSIENDPNLKNEYQNNEVSHKIFDLAVQLEGTIRSHGVHAAGVVIAPESIVHFAPLEMAQKGVVATQYSMSPIEELGLLKMDFLGLSNLTIIKNTLRIIKKVYDKTIDINNLILDDKLTFKLLARGDTTGVFQFESSGMKKYLKELHPSVFDDIVAMGALYRPGPLSAGLTESFIKRKNGLEKVEYAHPEMEPALKNTYGVLVYQEQFMQISRDVCGFSGAEADTLRKAIGKKNRDIMKKMEKRFIGGAVSRGIDEKLITDFWRQLLGFADYCFNKSHSACYGLISYQTAYLKAHYPLAFMAALMSSDYDNTDRLAIEISECKHMGIEVLLPSINKSYLEFSIDSKSKQIRFGLAAIKNVGSNVVSAILDIRKNGEFKNLTDFLRRVDYQLINKKTLESLIKSGALDCFDNRSTLLFNIDLIINFSSRIQKESRSGQVDLFDESHAKGEIVDSALLELKPIEKEIELRQLLMWERELLGLYLSQHPLTAYSRMLEEQASQISLITSDYDGKNITVAGMVTDFKEVMTKNGQKMAFIKLEDLETFIELILFPQTYSQLVGIWSKDNIVIVKGKVSSDNDKGSDVKIIVETAREITSEQANAYISIGKKNKLPKINPKKNIKKLTEIKIPKIYIKLEDSNDQKLLIDLKNTLDQHRGEKEVILVLGKNDSRHAIRLPDGFNYTDESLSRLQNVVGEANVKVQ